MDSQVSSIQGYHVKLLLAYGGQANVYLCQKDKKFFAVKVYTLQESSFQSFQRESNILSKMKHKNVIQIHQSIESGYVKYINNSKKERAIIAICYAQRRDLSQYITISKGFTLSICKRIFKQLLLGLQYISRKRISHRDLKPQNILINDNFELKISDFGLSVQMKSQKRLQKNVGTDGFKAPEVYQGQYNGQKVDVFSLGVTFFTLFSGHLPFTCTRKSNQLFKYIIKKDYQKFWLCHQRVKPEQFFPLQFKNLINSMLSKNPNERPQIQDLINNNWLNSQIASIQNMKTQMSRRYQLILQNRGQSKIKI